MHHVPGRAGIERVELLQALRGIAALAVVMFHGYLELGLAERFGRWLLRRMPSP